MNKQSHTSHLENLPYSGVTCGRVQMYDSWVRLSMLPSGKHATPGRLMAPVFVKEKDGMNSCCLLSAFGVFEKNNAVSPPKVALVWERQ